MQVSIGIATGDELDEILSVMDEAAAWLQSIGMGAQWGPSFSQDHAWVARFQRWIGEGRVFITRDTSGAALGCFRLVDEDAHIWPDATGSAVYLHSLAVRRSAAGSGVASAMLDWALQHAASRGVDELRLDCWAGNERLKRYYMDAGFEPRGDTLVPLEPKGEHAHRDYYVAKFAKKTGF